MLDTLIEEKWLTANGVFGFFPANAVGDDIEVYTDESRTEVLHHAAQPAPAGRAPRRRPEPVAGRLRRAPGDRAARPRRRLRRHRRARRPGQDRRVQGRPTTTTTRSCWSRSPTGSPRRSPSGCTSGSAPSSGATSPDEQLDNEALIAEKYAGHPPRPGLPGLPGAHREADALGAARRRRRNTGIELTESMAMWPGAAVSPAGTSRHPQSQYFVVGRLARDQVADYAERKGWTLAEAERWLVAQPRLRPGGLMRAALMQAVLWDMDGTLVDTEPYWIATEFAMAEKYGAHVEPRRTPCSWSATTWSTPAATSSEVMGLDLDARGDRRGAARRRGRQGRARRCRGDPGAVELLTSLAEAGVRVRPGDDVLPAVRGADPRPPAARDVPRRGDRRAGRATASRTPSPTSPRPRRSAYRPRSAWPSRTPTPAPSRPRRRAAWCWWWRTTCRCWRGRGRVFRDTLEGLTAADLAALSPPSGG